MKCRRCQAEYVRRGDWNYCPCDDIAGLTLTVREAASYFYVTRGAIYYWLRTGRLVASRSSGTTRVPMTSIKAFLASEHRAWRLEQEARGAAR